MSVVGFDVGNEFGVVGVAKQRGIDVVLNEESKRETPAMVSFNNKQRFIGTAAYASLTMNPRNTIGQIKRLIGRKFNDPEVQRDLRMLPYTVTEGSDGCPRIHVQYLGENKWFTPTQILAMILANLKSIAEKNLGTTVADCVIGIPVFFSEPQRRAYSEAAAIAGLRPLRFMHETTATALTYGIYKTDLPEADPINVVFVDVGHSSMQVCVAAFKKRQLKVLSHAFDRCLGGRDFDEILFNFFSKKFKEEYKIDVPSNARASQRLRAACDKLKKVLSANPEAPMSIECLMDEKDVKGYMKREDFEKLASPLLERAKGPCERALAEANLTVDKIHSVELVGSASRIPAILRILTSYFNKEPSRTLNASECVARGCALQCAMLSPTFKVREFQVQDSFPFSISVAWKGAAPECGDGVMTAEAYTSLVVFPRGTSFPSTKMLTFYRSGTFSIDVLYTDTKDLPPGTPQKISTYTIGPFQHTTSEKAKLKVKIRVNLHGIVSLESATLSEQEEVEVSVDKVQKEEFKDATAMEMERDGLTGDHVEAAVDGKGAKMSTVDKDEMTESHFPTAGDANGGLGAEEKPTKMEVEPPKEVVKKKKSKKMDVAVNEVFFGALSQNELEKAIEKEYEMALQDRVMEETKDRKNAVEAYIYDMRNKMYEKYRIYATKAEQEELLVKLQEVEEWLYEDGEDETKGVYISKLAELKKLGDPIEERYKEAETRGPAIAELQHCMNSFIEAAKSKDAKFDHIEASDKEKVTLECNKAEEWLRDKMQQQATLTASENPALLSADIKKKTMMLDRFCKPIMTKAPPPKPAAPSPEPKGNKPKDTNDNPANSSPGDGGAHPSVPMETDNPETQEGEMVLE
eukprot:c28754_g2_i5 orf=236-2818(+)